MEFYFFASKQIEHVNPKVTSEGEREKEFTRDHEYQLDCDVTKSYH